MVFEGFIKLVHIHMEGRRQFAAIENDTSTTQEIYDINL